MNQENNHSQADDLLIPDDRALTPEERRILEWLLLTVPKKMGKYGENAKDYVDQLQTEKVLARCGCGCQTRYLGFPGETEPRLGPTNLCIDALGTSPEGTPIYVDLHIVEHKLAILEIIQMDDTKVISFPRFEDLEEY